MYIKSLRKKIRKNFHKESGQIGFNYDDLNTGEFNYLKEHLVSAELETPDRDYPENIKDLYYKLSEQGLYVFGSPSWRIWINDNQNLLQAVTVIISILALIVSFISLGKNDFKNDVSRYETIIITQ